ncbi:MAG TPA: MerR family transcriptional regulator [Myxococcota bacterium]
MSWQNDESPKLPDPPEVGELLSIAGVRERTGLTARTLRYYEELGLLPGVRRRASGRRVYGADEIERLRFIQRLKKLGLSLAEIKELNSVYGLAGSTRDMLEKLDQHLGRHLDALAARLDELSALREEIRRYRARVGRRIRAAGAEGGAQR